LRLAELTDGLFRQFCLFIQLYSIKESNHEADFHVCIVGGVVGFWLELCRPRRLDRERQLVWLCGLPLPGLQRHVLQLRHLCLRRLRMRDGLGHQHEGSNSGLGLLRQVIAAG